MSRNKVRAVLSAMLAVCVVGFAFGDVFYYKDLTSNKLTSFSNPAAWGVGSKTDGNVDNRYPQEDDWMFIGDVYQSYFHFDMDGTTYKIKGLDYTNFKEDWGYRRFFIENGTFEISSNFTNLRAVVTCQLGGTFVIGDTCGVRWGNSGAAASLTAENTGSIYLGGYQSMSILQATCKAGGTFTLNPNGDFILPTVVQQTSYFSNQGTFNMPSGVTFSGAGADGAVVEFRQKGGTMTLGGSLVKEKSLSKVTMRFILSGGALQATDDAAVTGFNSVTMTENSSATVSVATDKTLNLSAMTFGDGTALVKTGTGALELGTSAPAAMTLSEGTLVVKGSVFGSLSVGEDVTISPDASLGEGDVVFAVTDQTGLDAAVDRLAPAPEGLEYAVANGIVSLKKSSAGNKKFTADGEANLADPSHWSVLPIPAGEDVFVQGANTIGIFDSTAPSFKSITVADGATLKVVGTITSLPPIVLDVNSRILFAEDSLVTLPDDFSAKANALQLPVFEVATGAVVIVGADRKFRNVHVKLYGEMEWRTGLTFGYAAANETAYFGFDSDGGKLRRSSFDTAMDKTIDWIHPADGGCVKVPGGVMTLRRFNSVRVSGNDYHGFNFGWGNPVDEAFELVLDETILNQWGTIMRIASSATIHCANGGGLRKPGSLSYWGYYNQVIVNGRIILDSGSLFQYHYSRNNVSFSPMNTGAEQLIVRDGSWAAIQYPQGDGRGVARFEDGWWDVMRLQKGDDGQTAPQWTTNVFHGFKSVTVPEGKFVGIRSSDCWQEGTPWNTEALLDPAVPITGGGSLVVSNATPGYAFTAIVACSKNTATGEAKVLKSADPSTLYFADGAKWAGTVVADGNVALTNLTDRAAAAAVTVGTLKLTGAFPLRLWKDGSTSSCDTLQLTDAVNGADGAVVPVPMNGYRPKAGEVFTIGSIAEDATLPVAAKGWTISAGDAVGGVCPLLLTRTPVGTLMIVR